MYKRILVPLDGSHLSESIIPFMEQIAGPLDLEVILFTVVPLPAAQSVLQSGIVFPEDLEIHKSRAKAGLAPLGAKLETKGFRVRILVTVTPPGEIAEEICRVAAQEGADLIAMSTHGRGGLGRLMFGSVTEEVVRNAPLPVLMIRMAEASVAVA